MLETPTPVKISPPVPELPTQDDLPYEDDQPMETGQHRLQMELLINTSNPGLIKIILVTLVAICLFILMISTLKS